MKKKKIYRFTIGTELTPQSFWPVHFADIDDLPSRINNGWIPSSSLEFLNGTPADVRNNNEIVPVVSFETIKQLSLKIKQLTDDLNYSKRREEFWNLRLSKLISDIPGEMAKTLCPDLSLNNLKKE